MKIANKHDPYSSIHLEMSFFEFILDVKVSLEENKFLTSGINHPKSCCCNDTENAYNIDDFSSHGPLFKRAVVNI